MEISRLLVIDDEQPLLDMMRDHFEPRGVSGSTAQTAEEGLRLAFKERPRVVILDLSLTDYPGEALLLRFKKNLPQTKVIILTGNTNSLVKEKMIRAGADAFVLKGGPIMEIQKKVEELMTPASE